MSVAYGRKCLEADAHPYSILVAQTACVGGHCNVAEWFDYMIESTLKHLNISYADFYLDVWKSIADMDAYDGRPTNEPV